MKRVLLDLTAAVAIAAAFFILFLNEFNLWSQT